MAELVDALVSKTSEVTLVPVRPRLRVLFFKPLLMKISKGFFVSCGEVLFRKNHFGPPIKIFIHERHK